MLTLCAFVTLGQGILKVAQGKFIDESTATMTKDCCHAIL